MVQRHDGIEALIQLTFDIGRQSIGMSVRD
jgi:hypothetical protein